MSADDVDRFPKDDLGASSEPVRKRPYQKPAFEREQLFETTALACGKVNPTTRQCQLVKKNS